MELLVLLINTAPISYVKIFLLDCHKITFNLLVVKFIDDCRFHLIGQESIKFKCPTTSFQLQLILM